MGGGGFRLGESDRFDDFILSLAPARTPNVCFIGTASGDAESYVRQFYATYGTRSCRPTHFPVFSAPPRPAREHLLDQDVVYIGGGSTANLLALWRVHGLDKILREAWEKGTILAGASAGALCLFEDGVTASLGHGFGPLGGGLGFLRGSFCPHYVDDADRTAAFRRLIAEGLAPGIGASDAVALRFVGEELRDVVSTRADAHAARVELVRDNVVETPLRVSSLPA